MRMAKGAFSTRSLFGEFLLLGKRLPSHMQAGTNTQATPLFRYKPFINFWLWFFDTRRETQFLKVPTACSDPNFSTSWSELNFSTVCINGRQPNCLSTWANVNFQTLNSMAENSVLYAIMAETKLSPTWPPVNSQLTLFQNLQILGTIASEHDVIHTPNHISYLGFIMTIVIVISFACKCKPYLILCTWTKSRIVQSPTKLNDNI